MSVDEASIRSIPGARVVRKGDFLGVVTRTVGRHPRRAAVEGRLGDAACASGQRPVVRTYARIQDRRQHLARARQRDHRIRRGCAHSFTHLPWTLSGARALRAELRSGRRESGFGAGHVLHAVGGGAGEAAQRLLRRRVEAEGRGVGLEAGRGADVDDATLAGAQQLEALLHAAQRPDEAARPVDAGIVRGEFVEQSDPRLVGRVDEHVEPAPGAARRSPDAAGSARDRSHRPRSASASATADAQLAGDRVELRAGASDQRHARAGRAERERDTPADSLACAGDQGDSVAQFHERHPTCIW